MRLIEQLQFDSLDIDSIFWLWSYLGGILFGLLLSQTNVKSGRSPEVNRFTEQINTYQFIHTLVNCLRRLYTVVVVAEAKPPLMGSYSKSLADSDCDHRGLTDGDGVCVGNSWQDCCVYRRRLTTHVSGVGRSFNYTSRAVVAWPAHDVWGDRTL